MTYQGERVAVAIPAYFYGSTSRTRPWPEPFATFHQISQPFSLALHLAVQSVPDLTAHRPPGSPTFDEWSA